MGGVALVSIGEESRGQGISLCVKFKTSRMLQSIARVSSKSRSRQLLESLDQSRSRQPTNFPVSISLGLETLKSESRSR